MEFLFYGESKEELSVQQIQEKEEDVEIEQVEEEEIIEIKQPRTLDPLEQEIYELLKDSSPDVLEQYKNMENAIRSAYQEISALDLPPFTPKEAVQQSEPEITVLKRISWDAKAVAEKKRGKFLRKHGVELTSELFGKKRITIPNAVTNQHFDRKFLSRDTFSQSEPELFSPAAKTIPDIKDSPNQRRWRPKSAFKLKKTIVEPVKVASVVEPLPAIDTPEPKPETKRKRKKAKKKVVQNVVEVGDAPAEVLVRLPLEYFDDPSRYESKSPQDILKDNQDPTFYLEAFSKYHFIHPNTVDIVNSGWKWTKCKVWEYDQVKKLFRIEWEDSKTQKWVRRFNLLFPGEKLADVSQRMEQASKAREAFEEVNINIKMIETSTIENMAPYPNSFKTGIIQKIGKKIEKSERKIIENLFDELEQDYIFAMKKTEYILKNKMSNTAHTSVNSEKFAANVLVESGTFEDDKSKVLLGKVAMAAKGLSEHMFSANAELQAVLLDVLSALRKIISTDQDFFSLPLHGSNEIISFHKRAKLNCETVQAKLIHDWPRTIATIIESRLSDYFNFQESSLKKYMSNRSRSFLQLVNAVMEGQLHNLVVSASTKYLGFFNIGVETVGDNNPPNSLESSYMNYSPIYKIVKPGPPLGLVTPFLRIQVTIKCPWISKSATNDLENLQLHPQNEIVLSPSLEEIEPIMLELLHLPAQMTKDVIPNIESLLLSRLNVPGPKFVKSLESESHSVSVEGEKTLSELFQNVKPMIVQLLDNYKEFEFLIRENVGENLNGKSPLEDFDEPIRILTHSKMKLMQVSSNTMDYAPIAVDCSLIKTTLENITNSLFHGIADILSLRIEKQCLELLARYEPLSVNIKIDPGLVAQWWLTLQTSITNTTQEIVTFNQQFGDVQKTWSLMYNYNMLIPEDIQDAYWTTYKWPSRMADDLEDARQRLSASRVHIIDRIEREISYVHDSTETFLAEIEFFETLGDISDFEVARKRITRLSDLVETTLALSASVNKQEIAMNCEPTNFDEFQDGLTRFKQYETLWGLVEDIHNHLNQWVNEWFMNLHAELMQGKVAQWTSTISECESWFDLDSNPYNVVIQSKEDVDDFWRNTNVIAILRNPALKEAHWKKIHAIIGLSLEDFQALRLVQILDLDLELVQSVISDICNDAAEVHQLEMNLEKMKTDLLATEFKIGPIHEIDLPLLQNVTQVAAIFEDQLVQCEKLYPMLTETESKQKFEKWLMQIQKALDMVKAIEELQHFQIRMQPILKLIQKEDSGIPKSTEETINSCFKTFTVALDVFGKNRKIINIIYRADLYDMIMGGRKKLNGVIDAIKPLLGKSRESFPRFCFVDDAILIETLACSNPTQLSHYTSHYFPACFKFTEGSKNKIVRRSMKTAPVAPDRKGFLRTNPLQKSLAVSKSTVQKVAKEFQIKTISGIVSHEGDIYTFSRQIELNGFLPDELKEVEYLASQAFKEQLFEGHIYFQKVFETNLQAFIEKYPLQTVIMVLRLEWSGLLMKALKSKDDPQPLIDFKNELKRFFDELVRLNRTRITVVLKIKIEAILGLIMEYQQELGDIIDTEKLIARTLHFKITDEQELEFSVGDSIPMPFGYEILGYDSRIILTPTMQTHLVHIINAVQNNFNVMAVGPPSSGKTGSIRQFSFLTGYRTAVYFCSEMSSYKLSNIISGSQLTNTWVVLKNLHLLEKNLYGQVFNDIPLTLKANSKSDFPKLGKIIFATIPSIREWGIFPPSLRSRLKIVGLSQPDHHYILQAYLVMNGFSNTDMLSKKLLLFMENTRMIFPTKTTLCKIQQILKLASQLRTQHPDANELGLIRQAISFICKSHILSADYGILKEILNTVFKHPSEDLVISALSPTNIQETLRSMQLQGSEYLTQKITTFFKFIEMRNPIFIYGDSFSSKSTIWKATASLASQQFSKDTPVKVFHCFPTTYCSIYSTNNGQNYVKEFKSILDEARSYCTESEEKNPEADLICSFGWIVFDADINSSWFDSIDGMVKEVDSSETEKDMIQMIYESNSLANASPKVLNHCSLLYVEPKSLKVEMIIYNLMQSAPRHVFQNSPLISTIFQLIVLPAIKHMQSDQTWSALSNVDRIGVARVFNMFLALLKEKGTSGYDRLTTQEQCLWVLFAIIFSTIWTVGADIQWEKRESFESFFRTHIIELSKNMEDFETAANLPAGYLKGTIAFPAEYSIFDTFVDEKIVQWTCSHLDTQQPLMSLKLPNVIITKELKNATYLAKLLSSLNLPIMVTGTSGVGKSLISEISSRLCASANDQTTESEIATILMTGDINLVAFKQELQRVIPKKRFNARGSAFGKRQVVFVEDMDLFKTQGGFWDSFRMLFESGTICATDGTYEVVDNIQWIGSYHSGAKRDYMFSRWARYFSVIQLHDNEKDKVSEMLRDEMEKRLLPAFSVDTIQKIVDASVDLLQQVRACYLRTPQNPQYLFTMNNLLVWIRSLVNYPVGSNFQDLVYQWVHCSHRIFRDRITSNTNVFDDIVSRALENHFHTNYEKLAGDGYFTYVQPDVMISGNKKSDLRVKDYQLLIKSLKYKTSWMAELEPEKILYQQALEMACHCSFTIQSMSKNFVFAGMDYGNRYTIMKLVAQMTKRRLFNFDERQTAEWPDFLKTVYTFLKERAKGIVIFLDARFMTPEIWKDVLRIAKTGFPIDPPPTIDIPTESVLLEFQKRIRICISFPNIEDVETLELITRYPTLLSYSFIHYATEIKAASVEDFIENQLSLRPIGGHIESGSIGAFLSWLKQDLPLFLKANFPFESQLYYHVPESVFTLISTFFQLYKNHSDEKLNTMTKIIEAIECIDSGFESIKKTQEEYDLHMTGIESHTIETEGILSDIENERMLLDDLNQRLNAEKDALQKNNEEVAYLEHFCVNEIEKLMPFVEDAVKKVQGLTRGDIYELKGLEDPSATVLMVMESVLLLLKYELKPSESSWDAVKKMISERGFTSNAANAVSETYILSQVSLHTIDRIQKSDAYNATDLTNTAALKLREWASIVAKLHQTRYLLIPKKKLLQDTLLRIQSREGHIHDLQEEIKAHETESNFLKQQFQALVKRNENATFRIKEVEVKLTTAQGITGSLHALKEKLIERHKMLEDSMQTLASSCLIASCAVSLLGCFSSELRNELIKRWNHGLGKFDMAVLPLNYKITEVLGPRLNPDPMSLDLFVFETVLMAKNHHKIPIIIDSYAKSIDAFKVVEKEGHIVVVNYHEKGYLEKIELAMSDGSIVLFLISSNTIFKDVQKVIRMVKTPTPEQKQSPDFERFKIYIILTGDLQSICSKSDWVSDFAPFKIFYSTTAVQTKIADVICGAHNIDLRQKIISKRNDLNQSIAKREMFLGRVTEFAGRLVEDDFYGGDLYKTMIDIQSQLEAVIFKVKHSEKSLNSISVEFVPYEIAGSALAQIYGVIYNMKNISSLYMFDLEDFLIICREKVTVLSQTVNAEDLKKYCEEVYRSVYHIVVPGYKKIDRLIFSVFLSLTIGNIEMMGKDLIWKISPENFKFLLYAQSDSSLKKPANVKNPSKAWLSDSKWDSILELSKIPTFSHFAQQFAKFANRATTPITETSWQEIHDARDPTKCEFPNKWQMLLSRPERMMVIRCLRPDSLANLLEDMCKSILGTALLDSAYPVDVFSQRLLVSSTHTPIVLVNRNLDDEVFALNQLAFRLQLERPWVSTPSILEQEMQEILIQITGKAAWLVISFHNEMETDHTAFFMKLQECIRAQPGINHNFRIWILCPPRIVLPPMIVTGSIKLFLEEEREFRSIFHDSFMVICSKADQIKQTKNYYLRKTLFNMCVLFSIIKFRMRSFPLTVDNYIDMQYSDLNLAYQLIFEFFENHPEHTSASKSVIYWYVFEKVWGSRIASTNERWFVGLFNEIINITWPSIEDKSEKALLLPPLSGIYDCYCADEFKMAVEQIGQLPRGFEFKIFTFGYGENISLFLEGKKSKELLQVVNTMAPEILNTLPSVGFDHDTITRTLIQFKSKVMNETHFSWYTGVDVKVNRTASARGERATPKTQENLAKHNFQKYRKMVQEILDSLANMLKQLNGQDTLEPSTVLFVKEMMKNDFPTAWKENESFYRSHLPFQQWTVDFISRLQFIRAWYSSKYETKATEQQIYLDISKLFSPEDLIPCLLMEASQQMNEPMENLELETIFISERQKNAAERGCYVTGLYLYGASFDTHKNALRNPKPSEMSTKFPSIWFLPKVKLNSESAKKGSVMIRSRTRRVTLRIQIPIYAYKVFNYPDQPHPTNDLESPLVGWVTVSSEYSADYWSVRNAYLVCEKPILDSLLTV